MKTDDDMKNARGKRFIEMIQLVGPDTPPPDFTQVVMNEILADAQEQTVTNSELKLLIQKAPIETPSAAFTYNAMKKVKRVGNAGNEPIIGKKAWFIATAIVIPSVLLLFLTMAPEKTSPITPVLSNVLYHLYDFIRELPHVYVLTLVCASALLLIDYFLSGGFLEARRTSQ